MATRTGSLSIASNDPNSPKVVALTAEVQDTPPWAEPETPGANGDIVTVALQSDSKIVIGGSFTEIHGIARNRIARLHTDGSVDTSFTTSITGGNFVQDIQIQPDDKIVVVGGFTTVNGESYEKLVRLNADGSIDETFIVPLFTFDGATNILRSLVLSNGYIVIGGQFNTVGGQAQQRVAMLDESGGIVSTPTIDWTTGSQAKWSSVASLGVQSDGKIMAGGSGRVVGGQFHKDIFRINTDDWTVDHSFGSGTDNVGFTSIFDLRVLSDDSILCIGNFTTYDGETRNGMCKFGSSGVIDNSYNPNLQTTADGRRIVMQADGKVIINGLFTTIGGVTRQRLARLQGDGSLDTSWPDFAPNTTVLQAAVQTDGKVVVVGIFTSFGGTSWSRIVRVLEDGTIDQT